MEVFDAPTHYYLSEALSLDELAYWVAFSRILGIGPVRFKLLLDYFHEDVAAAWKADRKELEQAGLDQKTIDGFLKQRAASNPLRELERLERLRVRVITIKDHDYPESLKEIVNAPPVLYVAGTLKKEEDHFALAIVEIMLGSFECRFGGRQSVDDLTDASLFGAKRVLELI